MAVRLYIGGLPPSVTPEDLAQRFKSFGDVKSAEVAPDKVYPSPRPGAKPMRFPRNFGFVSIVPKDEKSLERAMAAYNGSAWRGSTLRCKLATPSGPDYVAVEKLEDEEYAANPDVEESDPIPLAKDGTTLRIRQPYRKKLVTVVLGGSEVVEERLDGNGDGNIPLPADPAADVVPSNHMDGPRKIKTFEEHLKEVRERQSGGDVKTEPGAAGASTDAVLAYLDEQAEATAERKRFIKEMREQAPTGASWAAFAPPTSLQAPVRGSKRLASDAFAAEFAAMKEPKPRQRIRTVDFLSDTDLQGLPASRPEMDLSRFGSDSDDEGPPPRKAVIPQVDGAGDSSSSSDSESESGSDSDGSGSTSSSDEDEGAEKKSASTSSEISSDESSEGGGDGGGDGGGGAGKKRQRGSDSDSSSSDSETSSDETTTEDAGPGDAAANEAVRQGPGEDAAWMAGRLPAGAAFYRTEPMVQMEAAWRAGREAATRDVKERRRQALRQAGSSGGGKRKT